ncbi:MAG: hypothetical protein A2751_03440 [Candidatus Doudnabacteria bacterium RIFCSPHIGHO2_01_FULL_46_14]|uniref:Kynurenine formamidase n=1 Tax=Candidatus Doudnabacteria bacterium RIFCSPHIGHO2_01_FULL_46_14 TaxID=1817824 RepID=A0A1F5NKF7_9BACT|nr:MAG: hypothetical protein A2751_03440 [Candidatus Doudnabacteria bacterium RIFCSPHIGHO2_01_FULL_46_14]
MAKYIDISLSLDNTTFPWPGDTRFVRLEKKGSGIVSQLIMSTHTGTHIDAPKHFLFDKSGVDQIQLAKLIGPARVMAINSEKLITVKDILSAQGRSASGGKIQKAERILFKTRNSKLYKKGRFTADYVSLSLEGAEYLAKKKISLVGIDYLGIEAKSAPGHPVHKTLLAAGIVNLEGLDLSKVKPGNYNLAALPLKIKAGDGSPCRAILWR